MIDWFHVMMNASWIIGCSIILSAISYASWEASTYEKNFRDCLKQFNYQIFLNLGAILISIGLAGTSDVIWHKVTWILISVGFLLQFGVAIYRVLKISKSSPK